MKRMYSEEEIRALFKPKLIDSAEYDVVQEKWVWDKNAYGKLNHKYLMDYFDSNQDIHYQGIIFINDDNNEHSFSYSFNINDDQFDFSIYYVDDDNYGFTMFLNGYEIGEGSILQIYEL